MATVTLSYNRQDFTPLVAEFSRNDLDQEDRQFANAVWNGGLKNWSSAPPCTPELALGDADCRTVSVSGNLITKQTIIDFLRKYGARPGAQYLLAIADDMVGTATETP